MCNFLKKMMLRAACSGITITISTEWDENLIGDSLAKLSDLIENDKHLNIYTSIWEVEKSLALVSP